MYRKLQGFVREGKISKRQAKYFAYDLHSDVGGSFVHKMKEQGFVFDDSTFMEILGDYIKQSEKAQQDKFPDKIIEILKDLGLTALASELEELQIPDPSHQVVTRQSKRRNEETRKRWESACKEGNREEVEKLLREEKNLLPSQKFLDSTVTEEGNASLTPLAVASLNGRTDIVTLLIDNGASMSRVSSWTPLEMAVTGRHIDTAEVLRAKGSNPKYDLPREEEYYRRNADYRKRERLLINYNDDFEEKFKKLKGMPSQENDG